MKSVNVIGMVISILCSILCWFVTVFFAGLLIGIRFSEEDFFFSDLRLFRCKQFYQLFKAVGITITDASGLPAGYMFEIKYITGFFSFVCLALFFMFLFQSFRNVYREGKFTIYAAGKLKKAGIILFVIPAIKLIAYGIAYVSYDKYVQFVNEEGFIVNLNFNLLTAVVIGAALFSLAASMFMKKVADMEDDMEGLI